MINCDKIAFLQILRILETNTCIVLGYIKLKTSDKKAHYTKNEVKLIKYARKCRLYHIY